MDSDLVQIALPIVCVFLLGVVMFMGFRWSRKKCEAFQKTEATKAQGFSPEGKPILDRLTSKETCDKIKDGRSSLDPSPDKANAIKSDVIGTWGEVPFVITTIIAVFMVFLYVFN